MPGTTSRSMSKMSDDDGGSGSPEKIPSPQRQRQLHRLSTILPILIHVLSLLLYLHPLTTAQPNLLSAPPAVLDEAHIVSNDNADTRGTSSLRDVFANDYWGRPMNSPSSHKSWRPFSVLTFRYLKGGSIFDWSELFVHRLINVVLHAAVAEMAGIIATQLYLDLGPIHSLTLRCMTKLLFALHPSHVEVVANAANRPHILAVLMSALMCDPNTNFVVMVVAGLVALLSSETAIFQLPAVMATMTVIRWKNDSGRRKQQARTFHTFLSTMVELLPRYVVIVSLGLTYLTLRKIYDTLSIPDGLIRPAENPFYALTGQTRILTYALLLSIHVGKAVLVDPIGFSHEYGFECIRNIVSPTDVRLLAPYAVYVVVGFVTLQCGLRGLEPTLNWAVGLSWFLTLFPVSGLVKVGTSIADRIVVPSTFAFCILGGRFLAGFVLDFGNGYVDIMTSIRSVGGSGQGRSCRKMAMAARGRTSTAAVTKEEGRCHWSTGRLAWTAIKATAVLLGFKALWARMDRRSREWMDSMTLLESSLVSCPRSAKSNLEISKIYSGLYPERFDLDRALSFLDKAEEIDPNYCDIHQQYAHCFIQQGKYLEFEERLTKAVMCPFSMGGSVPLWQRYWKQVTSDPRTGEAARQRMDKYQAIINEAIQREVAKEEGNDENKRDKDQVLGKKQKKKPAIAKNRAGEL